MSTDPSLPPHRRRMLSLHKAFLVLLALALLAYAATDFYSLFTLEAALAHIEALKAYRAAHPLASAAAVFGLFVIMTALSLPGTLLLTVTAGALFGLLGGTVLISFASSLGATASFLASRWLFREAVQRRFALHLRSINRGIEKEGGFYLFFLRLVPAIPFVLLNPLMGLTPIRTLTFYWVTQLSGLLGTVAYVNAGTQLERLSAGRAVISPVLLLSLAAVGILPFALKRLAETLRRRL